MDLDFGRILSQHPVFFQKRSVGHLLMLVLKVRQKTCAQSKATPTLAAQAFACTSLCTLKFCRFTGQEYLANANYVGVFNSCWVFCLAVEKYE
jgi:hypothetical protein